jgi:pyruvate dehydrogenase E2 component (dihydrolipoamide acetyltransferase)
MLVPLVMPKLGLTMQEGTVVEWRARPGDAVRRGQVVLRIESEKVEFEVESPADGVLRAHVVEEGVTVPCGELIAVLSESADEPFALDAFLEERVARAAQKRAARGAAQRPAAAPVAAGARPERARASPRARRLAELEGVDLAVLQGHGPEGRITEEDVRAAIAALGPRIELDGARLGYVDAGQRGVPMLFLIGFGLDRSGWNLELQHFGASRRVLALDPRGTGASTDPGDAPLSVERLARDAIGLLAARGVDLADVVGSSLGAAVALEVARLEPARVRRLALLNPVFESDARLLAALDAVRAAAATGDGELRMRVMAPWLFAPRFLAEAARVERATRAMLGVVARVPERTLARQLAALRAWLAGPRERARVAAPALIVAGADDLLAPPSHARALAAALPGAKLEILEGIGHAPMVEDPERLHAMLADWLRDGA